MPAAGPVSLDRILAFAVTVLRIPLNEVWATGLRELLTIAGSGSAPGDPPDQAELTALMRRYPDKA